MNFGKLLAAGKSWVGGNGIGRYQMRKNIGLPKFISPRNPFKAEPLVEAPGLPPAGRAPAAQVAEVQPPAKKISWAARATGGFQAALMFCLDHNPFSAIGKPKLAPMPRFGKPVVQGELSLDKVKVVRSDLTHADLEVVHAGGVTANPSAAWKGLTARVFGAAPK